MNVHLAEKDAKTAEKKKTIVEDYIEGLKILKVKYDDQEYLTFIDDLESNDYILAFAKSASLATMRDVPENKKLGTKTDIDNYFKKQK
jgi:hypothetical protein